jgi:hypothetical protein
MTVPIDRLLKQAGELSDEDVLSQILSNRINKGSERGGLISVKQFDALVGDILAWRDWAATQAVLPTPRTDSAE